MLVRHPRIRFQRVVISVSCVSSPRLGAMVATLTTWTLDERSSCEYVVVHDGDIAAKSANEPERLIFKENGVKGCE